MSPHRTQHSQVSPILAGRFASRRLIASAIFGLLLSATLGSVVLLRSVASGEGLGPPPANPLVATAPFDGEHSLWTACLKRYVRDGSVAYGQWKTDGAADLGGYLSTLESLPRATYESWTSAERLAFWINVYNAYTVRLVLDNYPLKSVRSLGLVPGSAFLKSFIRLSGLQDKTLSLNDVEQAILRKEFKEPRIHFAIVCASKSCPALRAEAYRAQVLEAQLDEAARLFLRDEAKNRFDPVSNTFHLSSIFKWFAEDFERGPETLPAFLLRYAPEPAKTALREGKPLLDYLEYDWSLNGI